MKKALIFSALIVCALCFSSCKDGGLSGSNGASNTGSIAISNHIKVSGFGQKIDKVEVYNNSFSKTYYQSIPYGSSHTFSDIPAGTYSIKVRCISGSGRYTNYTKSGIKVNAGQTTTVSWS